MKKRAVAIATLCAGIAGCLALGACGRNPDSDNPASATPVSVNNGFEQAGEELLFEGSAGVTVSRNDNTAFVNTGSKSCKISVNRVPTPKFSFSDLTVEKDISEYDYLSFWVYLDGDNPVSLTNTANDGDYQGTVVLNRYYINASIKPRTWTKIKIEKGNAFFNNMMYHLPYGKFVLCGTGENFNSPMTYDFYIDDVCLYKKGMAGETELIAVDKETEETLISLPDGAVGAAYELPRIIVLGADGSELYGETPEFSVTDENGGAVALSGNTFTVSKAGEYTLSARYEKDGFVGKYEGKIRICFVDIAQTNTELAKIGAAYTLPALELTNPANGQTLENATVTVKVEDENGKEVAVNGGTFTPQEAGCYTLCYTIQKSDAGVENKEVYEKYVWASDVSGLVSDFTSNRSAELFCAVGDSASLSFAQSSLQAKYAADDNAFSLACEVNGVSFPSFRFGKTFPYANMEESRVEYISFWVYNGGTSDLYLVSSGDMLNRQLLSSETWSRVVFFADKFSSGFRWNENEFTVYGAVDASERITASLYIDDLRIHRAGDAEEVDFSEFITETDFNAATGEGVRFALNGSYTLDTRVYAYGSSVQEDGEATVHWVKDSNGATVPVDGKTFTPTREGWHTAELYYEKDGIANSFIKKFFVRPQLEFNPETDARDAVMPYGIAGEIYDASAFKPVLWNKGTVASEDDVRYSLTVTDSKGKKVATEGMVFTPGKKDLYTVSFYAQDTTTKEFATYSLKLGVFEAGKEGIAYDFEDGDVSVIRSTFYYYGLVNQTVLSEEEIGGNATKKAKIEVTDEMRNGGMAREPMFYLNENNILQNISLTKSFSFDIYIEDKENRNFNLAKVLYFNWNNQGQTPLHQGSLSQRIKSNQWVTITVNRADYESILGGYIFAGSTLSLGGQMWTELDTRFITNFYLVDSRGYRDIGAINIYLDNFRVEV